jgi:hypothetical protein
MIVGSVLLVIAAAVLLGLGLVFLDEPLLYASIGVSGLAAAALVLGVRRLTALRAGRGAITVRLGTTPAPREDSVRSPDPAVPTSYPLGPAALRRATPRPVGRAAVAPPATAPDPSGGAGRGDPAPTTDDPAEEVSAADATRIAGLTTEVVVVDGLPRYHLQDCPQLIGRDAEALPAAEAAELGFTPCGRCRPATALLRAANDEH